MKILRALKHKKSYSFFRKYSTGDDDIARIRNIGILAHIDAGKTTTTERMLYFSGKTKAMGEVHHGNTVTDFLEQERQRGITITNASVTFPWRDHTINLIDTPGHIDFTMEVEQCLCVLDGAVVVLDGSAGVEAQTQTVWRQSDTNKLARLFYINKMDRKDSSLDRCLHSIVTKLHVQPLIVNLPLKDASDKFIGQTPYKKLVNKLTFAGVVDLISLNEIVWDDTTRGLTYKRRQLDEGTDGAVWENVMVARRELIDTLSDFSETLADIIISTEAFDDIPSSIILDALREVTVSRKAFPVVCGSSYKNIGVQTLMDAVIDLLPSPLDCHKIYDCFEGDLSAKAFKVQHDDQRGILTFTRLFSGEVNKTSKLYNARCQRSEQIGSLYMVYANEFKPVDCVTAGNIAVVSGLKSTKSGDLLTTSATSLKKAKTNLDRVLSQKPEVIDKELPGDVKTKCNTRQEMVDFILSVDPKIPDPVFMCSIEAPSQAYQNALDKALMELQREDPSLRVSYNEETGQTVLSGMGELHLEIIKDRIVKEYKIEVELGPMQIAYRETILGSAKKKYVLDKKVGSSKQFVDITLSAKCDPKVKPDNILLLDKSAESASVLSHILPKHLQAIKSGIYTALMHGPKLGCPMVDVGVTLHWFEVCRGTSETMVAAAATHCLQKVLAECNPVLLEPVMTLSIVCPEDYSAMVIADLTRRRCQIGNIELRGTNKIIEGVTPLSELLGYSTTLRTLASGLATFSMEFHCNKQMAPEDEAKVISQVIGIY